MLVENYWGFMVSRPQIPHHKFIVPLSLYLSPRICALLLQRDSPPALDVSTRKAPISGQKDGDLFLYKDNRDISEISLLNCHAKLAINTK